MNFDGEPILVEFRPRLRVAGNKLIYGGERGTEVHAGTFLRQRRIVMDESLLSNAGERDRVLAHELFHFVWWKCGGLTRTAYEALVASEFSRKAAGEMGWSAELRKRRLATEDRAGRTRRWREYLCESFCDTGAAYALGLTAHPEITLGSGARRSRFRWMNANLDLDRLPI